MTCWRTTHGEGSYRNGYSPEYRTWKKMRSRCSAAPGTKEYKNYAQRGIRVCRRWDDYSNFLADMGRKPSLDHTIERLDNDRGYEPSNCCWATMKQQSRNRRANRILDVDGVEHTTVEWAEIVDINPNTIRHRLWAGWSARDAVKTPADSMGVRRPRKVTASIAADIIRRVKKGEKESAIARHLGLSDETVRMIKGGERHSNLLAGDAA